MTPFDLVEYMKEYAPGGVKISRLLYIFDNGRKEHREQAGLMALEELKQTKRMTMYTETVAKMQARGYDVAEDTKLVAKVTEDATKELMKLEHNFGMAKTGVKKEDSRQALKELGRHYYEKGMLQSAMKHYAKMRDYCTTPAHVLEMCLDVVTTGIEAQSWTIVNQHCSRAEQTEASKDKICKGKIRAAQALLHLDAKKYKLAAQKLLDIPGDLGDHFAETLPGSDIVTYAAVLVCATFTRQEIKSNVLGNNAFRPFFDLNPVLFQAIKDLAASNYKSGLQALNSARSTLEYDPFIQAHLPALYEAITQRWFKQYTCPYLTIDLNKMAEAFGYTTPDLEAQVAQLIADGHISARIDSDKKVLHSRVDKVREQTFSQALVSGKNFVVNTEDQLRRMNMHQNGFEYVRPRDFV